MSPRDAVEASQALEVRVIGAEAAGIFWLGAEVAILLVVLAGRAYVAGPPSAPLFPPEWKRRALGVIALLGGLGVLVLGRHAVWRAPHRTPSVTEWGSHGDPALVEAAYHAFVTAHHGVWLCFVAAWVLLEGLIVWHGVRLYQGALARLRA